MLPPVWCELLQYGYGRDEIKGCQRVVMLTSLRVCKTVLTDAMQVLMASASWNLVALRHEAIYQRSKAIAFSVLDLVTNEKVQGSGLQACRPL